MGRAGQTRPLKVSSGRAGVGVGCRILRCAQDDSWRSGRELARGSDTLLRSELMRTTFSIRLVFAAVIVVAASHAARAGVDFSREVRPILASKCFACHGPDDAARKSKLRLDVRDASLKPAKSDAIPIVPGKPDQSELVKR